MRKADVVKFFGSQTEAADALDVTKQAVARWGAVVPERIAHRAALASDGKLKVDPTVYWNPPSKKTKPGDSDRRAAAG